MKSETTPEDLKKAIHAMEQSIPGPNPARQAAARQAFLAEARRLRQEQAVSDQHARRHIGWKSRLWAAKENPIMATLAKAMVALVMATGLVTGTAMAADSSLPGGPLYPADLALEQAQLALTTNTQAQAQFRLKLVEERADELLALAESGQAPDDASLDRLQEQAQLTLTTLAQVGEQQRVQLMTQLRDQTATQAAEFNALDMPATAGLLMQVREMAQMGIDDPAGFENHVRNGMGWSEDVEPVDEEPEDTGVEAEGEIVEDETLDDAGERPYQTQDQLRDQTCDQLQDPTCDQTQDQTQDQLHDQTQDQLQDQTCTDQTCDQTQDQTQDQLQDGNCMDCDPMGDGPMDSQGDHHQDDHSGGGGNSGGHR
jgi:hypothetical protein